MRRIWVKGATGMCQPCVVAIAATLVAAATSQAATTAFPIVHNGAVAIVESGSAGPFTIRFANAGARRQYLSHARAIDLECARLGLNGAAGKLGIAGPVDTQGVLIPLRHPGNSIAARLRGRFDVCVVRLTSGRAGSTSTTPLGRPVALTPAGTAYLNRSETGGLVSTAAFLIVNDGTPGNFAPAASVARRLHAVVLANPGPPPAGQLGVYSDGQEHAYAAMADGEGVLLYVDINAGVVSTDIPELVSPLGQSYP